jgi:DNA (cytosine-5)-methyltransferase 1
MSRKPKALDLFCCASGASMGLHQAGFDVTGVDIEPQPRYPFRFIQADALTFPLEGYDFAWASPMCQDHSKTRKILEGKGLTGKGGGDQIARIRERLIVSGLPYVIENVPGAPLINPITLCGTMFGLKVIRHRRFESNFLILQPKCGRHGKTNSHRGYSTGAEFVTVGGNNFRRVEGAAAMGIDWMKTRPELSQAIPPAYAKYIGEFAMQHLGADEGGKEKA